MAELGNSVFALGPSLKLLLRLIRPGEAHATWNRETGVADVRRLDDTTEIPTWRRRTAGPLSLRLPLM